jgi:hypothetical protein
MMIAVAVIAMLLCGAMTGARWVGYYWRASIYAANERQWREMAARDRGNPLRARSVSAVWGPQIAEDYAQLTRKYRRAMWRPWSPVAPDPPFMYYPPRSP